MRMVEIFPASMRLMAAIWVRRESGVGEVLVEFIGKSICKTIYFARKKREKTPSVKISVMHPALGKAGANVTI